MSKIYIILLTVFFYANVYSQQAYFVDGYHGGIYGHYPVKWKTQFIVDQLAYASGLADLYGDRA